MFRLVQVFLRYRALSASVQDTLRDPSKRNSVLSKSAQASNLANRRVQEAWTAIYPLFMSITDILSGSLGWLFSEHIIIRSTLQSLEDILSLALIMLEDVKSDTFDYSAVSLSALWIKDSVDTHPALLAVSNIVTQLTSATQITRGLGQTEIWAAFRLNGPKVPSNGLVEHINDPGKCGSDVPLAADPRAPELRSSILELLSREDSSFANLDKALSDVQSVLDPNASSDDGKWHHSGVRSTLEVSAFASQASVSSHRCRMSPKLISIQETRCTAIAILAGDHSLPLASLIPVQSHISHPNPANFFKSMTIALRRALPNGDVSLTSLFSPNLLDSVLRFR